MAGCGRYYVRCGMTKATREIKIMIMRYLLLLVALFSQMALSQQLTYRLPRDANNTPLMFGVGNPYAYEMAPVLATYDTGMRIQVPSAGNDVKRVYRHIGVTNLDATRTVYICFGDATGCTIDGMILPPLYSKAYETLRFGKPVNFEYIYLRLDSAGTANVTVEVW